MPYYQPPSLLFLDMHRFTLQDSLYGSYGYVGEGIKPIYVIAIIDANDQMIIYLIISHLPFLSKIFFFKKHHFIMV
jgi:hypothetical protein